MSVMPSSLKKWMCPSHADHVMVGILASLTPAPHHSLSDFQPIRRSVKSPRIIEVKHPGMKNNGNVEIIPSAEDLAKETVPYEDIYINNRRYMIPEKVIRLDFLQKAAEFQAAIGKSKATEKYELVVFFTPSCLSLCRDIFGSFSSSPLTSLTSLTDDEDRQRELEETDEDSDSDSEDDDVSRTEAQAAQALLEISKGLSVS